MKNKNLILGQRLRKLRKSQNIKTEELSEKIGLSPSSLSTIERGERLPMLETFIKLCQVLKADPKYFFPTEFIYDEVPTEESQYGELFDLLSKIPPDDIPFLNDLLKTAIKRYEKEDA